MRTLKRSTSGVSDDDAEPMTTRKGKAPSAMPTRSKELRCCREMWATTAVRLVDENSFLRRWAPFSHVVFLLFSLFLVHLFLALTMAN